MTQQFQNKTRVLEALDAILIRRDITAIDIYFDDTYREHHPGHTGGLATLRDMVTHLANNPEFAYVPVRAIAQGDWVAVHGRYVGWAAQPLIAVDLFRLQDGKIVEHWDGMAAEMGPNPSGHTMLDGPTESRNAADAARTQTVVQQFVEAVLIGGQMERLPEFFAGDNYIQHNPLIADGLSGLGAFMNDLQKKGLVLRYERILHLIAEGDFAVIRSEGEFGGKKQLFSDIFRVQDGKIAEHWDVIQEINAPEARVPAQESTGVAAAAML